MKNTKIVYDTKMMKILFNFNLISNKFHYFHIRDVFRK